MMYKVLIVDDELFVRIGLKSAIDWEKHGFALVGDAPGGVRALEMIAGDPPDIVITDIKMPGMDGTQLIREIKAKYPSIQCVVLSNYGDFEYVREAMKNGAVDYFLKASVDPEKLIEALEGCRMNIDRQRDSGQSRLRSEAVNGMLAARRQFFSALLEPSGTADGMLERAKALGIRLQSFKGYMMAVKMYDFALNPASRPGHDGDAFSSSVVSLAEELVNQDHCGGVFERAQGSYVCLVESGQAVPAEKLKWLAERVKSSVYHYLGVDASVFYGMRFCDFDGLKRLLSELDGVFSLDFYEESGVLATAGGFTKAGIDAMYLNVKKEIDIRVGMSDGGGLAAAFGGFLEEAGNARIDPALVKNAAALALNHLRDLLIQRGAGTVDSAGADNTSGLARCDTFAELRRLCGDILEGHVRALRGAAGEDYREEILKVVEYIHRNYPARITLEGMSKLASMNKSYFCRLFKKETGENFQDYLIRIRMEKAGELLAIPENKIESVSRDVGYNDISYFTRAFKRHYRVSPGEYKRNRKAR